MKVYSSSSSRLELGQIGGKAFNLFRLKSAGLNVPDWTVIDQSALVEILPDELRSPDKFDSIRAFIDEFPMPDDILSSVETNINRAKNKLFAIRSSAVQEDGKDFSFAGQFETHLYVEFNDIPRFVKEIWKSNFTDRVAQYIRNNNLEFQYGIGVVIQEMIDPDVAGVAFGINPNTGEENSKVICSVYGVGEGLVSGALNADTFNVSGNEYESILVSKQQAARRAKSGEVELVDVAAEQWDVPSLNDSCIQEINRTLDVLKSSIGSPQDIEFAVKNNEVFLLQTRPITQIHKAAKKDGKNRIIWDNSNIVESYPGVTTPLTFSYILEAYKQVYIQLALIMGASKKTVAQNEETFGNMLGLINGRVYYNLLSWYKVLALFPGYRLNARFMENMMGVKERFDLPKQQQSSKVAALYRTSLMIFRIVGHTFTIKKETRRFLKEVDDSLAEIKALNLSELTAYELMQTWVELDAYLTPRWKAPVINDSFAMMYFGRLQKLIEKYKISDNKNLQNNLLCGSKDIISVEPIHRSIALATDIQDNPEWKSLFENESPEEIWTTLENENFKELRSDIETYIEDFGDRCVGELKLETISYKQDPSLFIAHLRAFVIQGVTKSSTESTVDQELRAQAEKEVDQALSRKPLKRRKFIKTLQKTRYFVSNRENLRYDRTRVFGITREIFAQIGQVFEREGKLNSYRDIFYMTQYEIFAFIKGTAVDSDLKALTSMRKKEYAAYEEMELPAERFVSYDAVHINNNFFDTSIENVVDGELSGLGCCPGHVKANVRIVKHPSEVESLNGDILVTSSTDPGWVTLFPTASAIIVERGSLLSHSAIVSREMGIPCIVGVTGLLKTLKTGDLIEMDGSTGAIKILENE